MTLKIIPKCSHATYDGIGGIYCKCSGDWCPYEMEDAPDSCSLFDEVK